MPPRRGKVKQAAAPAQERLWCEPGEHHWTRDVVRGKKPVACPEHRDIAQAQASEAAREARFEKTRALIAIDEANLYSLLDDEDRRQIAYIDSVITTGRSRIGPGRYTPRDEADIRLMAERRKEILKQLARRQGAASPVEIEDNE